MMLVLAFMALAVPIVTMSLSLSSTLNIDSQKKTKDLTSQYSVLGGSQHALHRLVYEPGYLASLPAGVSTSYLLTLNGETVNVTVLKRTNVSESPPPGSPSSIVTTKTVLPTSTTPSTPTTFTYTITIANQGTTSQTIKKIHDGLPAGFSYVSGSTTGLTTQNPTVDNQENGLGGASYEELTWNVSSLGIVLQPSSQVTLTFQAQANVDTGNYCNIAWIEPGGMQTASGPDAKVRVGSPSNPDCQAELAIINKTVTPKVAPSYTTTTFAYTITVQNAGTETINASWVTDLLPSGFSYVPGSTLGDLASADPLTTPYQGRERLRWHLAPSVAISPGQTKMLTFQAVAILSQGYFENEVWVSFGAFSNDSYSWPTAGVTVEDYIEVTADDGETVVYSTAWFDGTAYRQDHWSIIR
jgi:uncharacterized repeat protein (TIGR01451 family)